MKRIRLTCVLPLLLLAACSSDKPVSKATPAQLTAINPAAKIEVRWDADIGSGGQSVLVPAVTREAVFAANASGRVFRLDRKTGKKDWTADTGFAVTGGVGAGEGLVLVGGEKGELAAFDADTGKLKWRANVASDVLAPPSVADGIVVVRTGNQRLTGLSVKDGGRLWLYERSTPSLIVRSNAGVVIRGGVVYAGFAAGKLAAINLANGVVVWEGSVSQPRGNTELERISDITSLPVVNNEQICAVAFQGRLTCFDVTQGSSLWTRDVSSDKGLALSGSVMYLTDAEGNVLALGKSTGSSLWKNDKLQYRQVSAPFPLDDYLLVGDAEGYLHVLKSDDGSFVARSLLRDAIPTYREGGTASFVLDNAGDSMQFSAPARDYAIKTSPLLLGEGALVSAGGHLYFVVIKK